MVPLTRVPLTSVLPPQEAAGEGIPILLLGNKMDIVGEREVKFKDAEILAQVSLNIDIENQYYCIITPMPAIDCIGY